MQTKSIIKMQSATMFLVVCLALFSGSRVSADSKSKKLQAQKAPVFTNFVYQGNDKVYNDFTLKPG